MRWPSVSTDHELVISNNPAHDHQAQDRQGNREQAAGVGFGLQHLIEGQAGEPRDGRKEHIGQRRSQEKAGQQVWVAQQVRKDPAHRTGTVIHMLIRHAELTL